MSQCRVLQNREQTRAAASRTERKQHAKKISAFTSAQDPIVCVNCSRSRHGASDVTAVVAVDSAAVLRPVDRRGSEAEQNARAH